MLARHAGGIVRAVIRTDVNIYMIHRISLRTNAVEQITDDILLIARSDENGNAVVFIAADKFLPLQQRHRHIKRTDRNSIRKRGAMMTALIVMTVCIIVSSTAENPGISCFPVCGRVISCKPCDSTVKFLN